MNRQLYRIWLLLLVCIPSFLFPLVGEIQPGQTLWYIACKIAGTADIIESKVCLIESQLDVVESEIDLLATTQEFYSIGDILCSKLEALDMSMTPLMASGLDQFEELLCSKIELLQADTETIDDKIDTMLLCVPTPITAPTTITEEGTYCVANPIDGSIEVQASNVVVYNSGYRIFNGGMIIDSSVHQVTFDGGVIEGTGIGSNGIEVRSGASDITINDMVIKDAGVGIFMDGVVGGVVKNCELTANYTGLELYNSAKIEVDKTIAECNTNAGFDLVNSTTCLFTDCKALSTGEGNTQITDATIFGFASTDGFGNIFERCIANSTQALSTTDFNSVIAGFAFRGDEKCSKIIDSESANATSSPDGVTVPYGILLEARFDGLITATVHNSGGGSTSDSVQAVNWSPDGKYLAASGTITGGNNEDLFVYRFDTISETLIQIVALNPGGGSSSDGVGTVHWSPDGNYLAVGGTISGGNNEDLFVYRFDTISETLTQVVAFNPGGGSVSETVNSVHWSPDGNYLAVGGNISGGNNEDLFVYRFDKISETLIQVAAINPGGGVATDQVFSVNWSPDGNYLAVGGDISGGGNEDLFVYRFDRGTETLIQVVALDPDGGLPLDQIRSVSWSPDGNYLAVGGSTDYGTAQDLFVYRFDRGTETLIQIDALNPGGGSLGDVVRSAHWSPDGNYLAVGGTIVGGGDEDLFVYRFDRGLEMLTQIDAVNPGGGGTADFVFSVNWSPDGSYLAIGGNIAGGGNEDLIIYNALTFPSKNVIKNNTVYCNSGAQYPSGVGISGSSISNLIIGNTAYSNPIPQMTEGGGPIVSSNYAFVTNVFNELFGDAPSDLQNISVGGCEPICTPEDLALLLKQIKYKVCAIQSQEEVILSKIEANINQCEPTNILASTTITEEGVYCVANQITDGPIEIAASNVVIEMNGYRFEDGVLINGGLHEITLRNGVVEGTSTDDAIKVNSGTTDVTLENITTKNAIVGINMENVTGGTITNCSLTQNTTGVQLTNSHKINFDNTIASCNTNAGFDLINSTTCVFTDCKALSTGEGNTQITDQTVFGFVSTDGFGNIFERCIANSTQALSTTDFNSVVAGFALRGDEKCSKIIDSESANSITSPDGVTVPYGILLEGALDELVAVTSTTPYGITNDNVLAIEWSPDGKYLAVGLDFVSGRNDLLLYEFDYQNEGIQLITTANPGGPSQISVVRSIAWSPDGNYVALVGNLQDDSGVRKDFQIYKFDSVNKTLTRTFAIDPLGASGTDFVLDVSWASNGRYIAISGNMNGPGIDYNIVVYRFDKISETVTQTGQALPLNVGDTMRSVAWSPDGDYLASTGVTGTDFVLFIYQLDKSTGAIINQLAINVSDYADDGYSVAWSPNGKYLAVAGRFYDPTLYSSDLYIYSFDRTAYTAELVTTLGQEDTYYNSIRTVAWSPDSQYLAVGGFFGAPIGPNDLFVYRFDPSLNTLSLVTSLNPDQGSQSDDILSIDWSPDGQYLAVSGDIDGTTNFDVIIYQAIQFPQKNVIKNNTVYCNSGGQLPYGVGISGSSIANMIIGNTAYSNPIPQMTEGGGPIVVSNYQFVTNVFNELFGNAPTDLQNISVGGCEPICMPADLALLAKQIKAKVCHIFSQQDVIESKIDLNNAPCGPIPITTPTTITAEGVYCVGNMISGDIQVATSNVTIYNSGYRIAGSMIVDSGVHQVTFNGGIVEGSGTGSNGIEVQSGTSQIYVENITVKDAEVGINMQDVTGATIRNCSMTLNTTGMQLSNSHKIIVENSTAACNTNAGFDLLNSTTCIFEDCKALSTGEGNTQITEATIFGFVSTDGYGNIFERCIANSTQALSTTDSQSVVAGFAFRGDEKCSKIIDSESANATTAPDGVTVPYGILLQAQFDQLIAVTWLNPESSYLNDNVAKVAWSPDGKYLAVGTADYGNGDFDFQIYSFNTINPGLSKLVAVNVADGIAYEWIDAISWSPDGRYLAVGGYINMYDGHAMYVYRFDSVNNTLTQISEAMLGSTGTDTTVGIDWSHDGRYISVAGFIDYSGSDDGNNVIIFKFDSISETTIVVDAIGPVVPADQVYVANWSPDDNYIAITGILSGDDLLVYRFDKSTETLVGPTDTRALNSTIGRTLNWSSDGQFLAVGDAGGFIYVYKFNPIDGTLNDDLVISIGNTINEVNWSPDNQYLAVVGDSAGAVFLYYFDRGARQLFLLDEKTFSGDNVFTVDWSPDGAYLAVGGSLSSATYNEYDLIIYTALTFPSKNVVKNNTVYCNSGAQYPSGVGISGSSILNMIIGNTAYSNPLPQMTEGGGPIVFSNYYFVTNVFNQLFGQAPTDLQNIALGGCEPICTPDDLALLVKQSTHKMCVIDSKIGDLSDLSSCFPTLIDTPEDVNNTQLTMISWLKSILSEIRGCNVNC